MPKKTRYEQIKEKAEPRTLTDIPHLLDTPFRKRALRVKHTN
jgi:hypothetical protein